ncbi:glycosyltransferase [Cerasicoccus fimbriatus]|uniref:glycosyltransferase n=1 Tax=Cerasicoccus fimbriatus TaxID=3014554 RepID=UPI0022B43DD7|nr:glycosyltransferase [Cerasicoccus sp. TK19100]
MADELHILFNTGAYPPARCGGGPIKSVSALAKKLVQRGCRVTVAAINCDGDEVLDVPIARPVRRDGVDVLYFDTARCWWQGLPLNALQKASVFRMTDNWHQWIWQCGGEFDVINSQLGFLASNPQASLVAKSSSSLYFYHQRGNLDPRRFGRRAWLKKLFITLCEQKILKRADALIALSQREADVYRSLRPNARIAHIPNGVDVEAWRVPAEPSGSLKQDLQRLAAGPMVVWLNRYDSRKGPDIFIDSIHRARQEGILVNGLMAGPDATGMLPQIQARIHTLGLGDFLIARSGLEGADLRAVLHASSIYALPTSGEGFSMGLLEAMAAGSFVVTTPEANFPELELHHAGLVVDCSAESFKNAYSHILSKPHFAEATRNNARALVGEQFNWDAVVDRYLALVRELRALRAMKLICDR